MLLSHKMTIKLSENYSNILGHMCYAAYKLWNVCNYERLNYKELNLPVEYPDWYYQKKVHKNNLWYKQLPSQTAQEVCKLLDKGWKSFYALQKSHGVENPHPPHYKHDRIPVTYMQNGIKHMNNKEIVRLSISGELKEYMAVTYDIHDKFLYLKNKIFKNMDNIKQIKVYPPEHGSCNIIVIYKVQDVQMLPDNGRYLSIDLGVHNLMTCYNSTTGESFIAGRKYLSFCEYYNKEIARVQLQWSSLQKRKGIKYPKSSKHICRLYKSKSDVIYDYLHKVTRYVVDYCIREDIHTVVIGDITNIRKGKNFGSVTNQKIHALPYKKIYNLLKYKCAMVGIHFIRQKEFYSSQTSPLADRVDRRHADKKNRVKRGLYQDGEYIWNADCVGAFNILRLYFQKQKIDIHLDPISIGVPYIAKVAV